MTDNRFPAASYAEALPYLRAPYTPDLVYGIVVSAPNNNQAPCKIALGVSIEAVMSRLNIVCGLNWGVVFEEVVKRHITRSWKTVFYEAIRGLWDSLRGRRRVPSGGFSDRHYVRICAHVTVFGRTFTDFGEATDKREVMAEYKARAQAFRRAARWVEVGHCLYTADLIEMWRGEGDKQLRTPTTGEKPHTRPYQDERSERHIQAEYATQLARIERTYGEPLDHQIAAQGRTEMPEPHPLVDTQLQRTVHSARQDTIHPLQVPARGMIVNPEVVQCARDAGFGAAVAPRMTLLARGEEQIGQLTQPQIQTVQGWIADLSSLSVKEETVLAAISFFLERSPNREAARTKFVDWIKAKAQTAQAAQVAASAELPTATPPPGTSGDHVQAPDAPVVNATTPDAQAPPNGQPVSAIFPSSAHDSVSQDSPATAQSTDRRPLSALEELVQTIERHNYQQSVVQRLIALAQGQGPEWQIAWESLPEDRLREITRLLRCAAQVGWDNARLQQMVMRAHHSAQQNTPAGRYATFGNHLTNAARDHAAEAARMAA